RQRKYSETHAHQPAHGDTKRLEHAAHDAVTAFFHHDAIPVVRALAAFVYDGLATSQSIVQRDSRLQALDLRDAQRANHAHRVLALELETRMHHAVREIARGGEHE